MLYTNQISNLVIWLSSRIFEKVLFGLSGLEESEQDPYSNLIQYSPFSLKIVPFSQFWAKSNNPNTHFRAFFMLYTNQITKIGKKILLLFGLKFD